MTPPFSRLWVEKLAFTGFRNYAQASLHAREASIVLLGANGSGKTNCLEAVSLLTAGRGLRGAPFSDLAQEGGSSGWAVTARLFTLDGPVQVGTGVQPAFDGGPLSKTSRIVKIDGAKAKSSGALAAFRMLWLTPAMDGLFTGPASERRRFMDRFVLSLDPGYGACASIFERAMKQRNKALETFAPPSLISALETQMAEAGASMAHRRTTAFEALQASILDHPESQTSAFPWSSVSLSGDVEARAAQEGEEAASHWFRQRLAEWRERDRAAGRTLTGPHRSDFFVAHGPKGMPARLCSTGEQKALLIGLVLAQARLVKQASGGVSPILLMDEIAAHLDVERRSALFDAFASLGAQVWMTGTDAGPFAGLREKQQAQFFLVANGAIKPLDDAESLPDHYI